MPYVNEAKQTPTELVYDSVMVQLFKNWLIEESREADKIVVNKLKELTKEDENVAQEK